MSTVPDNEFDLEKLFLPAWAQEEPSASKYAKYEGMEGRSEARGDRRGPRRGGGGREAGRPRGPNRRPSSGPGQPGRPEHARRGPGRERGERRGPRSDQAQEPREPLPLPELSLSLVPEEKGVESLARQIKMAGRAYPLFDIAHMILQKPERYTVVFGTKKNGEGKILQSLFQCALDETLWLSEDEAVAHVLNKHFNTFYQADRTATEPPKGKYTFVAQCGLSGMILGPPNHHDYQNQLRKLHAERFSRMPFEAYKARVKIVRDEEVVKKWVEDQSWKTEYVCLNMPEPLRLNGRDAVEKHFRENHKDNIIKAVDTYTLSGTAARSLRSPGLVRLVRSAWEDQRRFPLQIATVLSQQFAGHGLQFFKVNRTITHVCVARPHYLDLELIPVSDGVKRIVDYIQAHPKCSRRQLVEALAPTPPPAPIALPAEGQPPAAAVPEKPEPTPEQTVVIADLHWLIHQGHVIEFANGILECAKKPLPKPPKPAPPAAESAAKSEPMAGEVQTGLASAPGPETVEGSASSPADDLVVPADPGQAGTAGAEAPSPESTHLVEPAAPSPQAPPPASEPVNVLEPPISTISSPS